MYEPKLSIHVPLFLHGLLRHSLTSSVQFGPLKPGGHVHLYLLLSVIEHRPPFLQGDDAHRLDFSQFRPILKNQLLLLLIKKHLGIKKVYLAIN